MTRCTPDLSMTACNVLIATVFRERPTALDKSTTPHFVLSMLLNVQLPYVTGLSTTV